MTASTPRTAAWRFVGAGISGGVDVSSAGAVGLVHDDGAVRQSLLLLLATAPGERVMRPDYGCPLHRLAFQPLDDTTAGLAIHHVEQAVRRFEPRAEVLSVDAGPSPSVDGALLVELRYRVRASGRTDVVAFDLPLGDGIGIDAPPATGGRR